jgi:alkylation response protein AidB-like acyl-CoA dehydrogenase
MSVSDIYASARGLGGFLKGKSAEIDEARRLPPDVVARVRQAGMFRLVMPKSWGGPELSTIEQVEVIEELSKAERIGRMVRDDRLRLWFRDWLSG